MSSPYMLEFAAGELELSRVALGDGVWRLRTGRSHAGEGRFVPSGTRGESTGMLQTAISTGHMGRRDSLLRQNSSIISALRRPHKYRPEKRLSRPTHERSPSMEGAIKGRKSALRQFNMTATSVRPA